MEHFDIVVVGAGLGGLTAGALAAKRGLKVLVLEQHARIGGCATGFRRHGSWIEVGLQALDGLDAVDLKGPVFEELGLRETLTLLRPAEVYRYHDGRSEVVLPNDPLGLVEALAQRFPSEARPIQRLVAEVTGLRRQLSWFGALSPWGQGLAYPVLPFRAPAIVAGLGRSVGGYLDSRLTDPLLKAVLTANLAYFGDDPYRLSLFYYALGQGSYWAGGAHYIQGGSQGLAERLGDVITHAGGEVRVRSRVTGLDVSGSRITGVRYRPLLEEGEVRVETPRVIAGCAVPLVVQGLLPPEVSRGPARAVARLRRSPSMLSVYCLFNRPPSDFGNRAFVTFFQNRPVDRLADLGATLSSWWTDRAFSFTDYSQVDSRLTAPGLHLGVINTADRGEVWADLSQPGYEEEKRRAAEILVQRLDQRFPGLAGALVHQEASTARTVERYTGNPGGAIYGFAQTPGQSVPFRFGQQSSVRGLFYASAWTFPGGGFSGAMISGLSCANRITR